MIYEYAIDPALVATWHDRASYSFFDERFGLITRRIVSQFPKKWKKSVWEIFINSADAENQNSKMRMDALLHELSKYSVRRNTSFEDSSTWLEQAEKENNERPFRAILSTSNPRTNDSVIEAARLLSNGHDLWKVPDTHPVPRTAQGLLTAISPILRVSRRIYFLDPYFDPYEVRFKKPMESYLNEIWQKNYFSNSPSNSPHVELQIGIDRFFPSNKRYQNRDVQQETRVCIYLKERLDEWLNRMIPENNTVHINLIKQREFGELLHNRYLLTDFCGVMFGTGTDQARDSKNQETDILSFLKPLEYQSRWNQIAGSPPAYDSVLSFTITK